MIPAVPIGGNAQASAVRQGHRPVSFVSYHTQAISMGIVKADAYTVFYASISAKAKLCRLQERRGDNPTPGVGPDAGSRGCA